MDDNFNSVPLDLLTQESRNILSLLLNTNKVILSDGPEKLPRDWRGLASLINISAEVATNINECKDKTGKVLEIWIQRRDGSATLGTLFNHLQKIDRFDVYDDLLQLAISSKLYESRLHQLVAKKDITSLETPSDDFITFDDVRLGCPQYYHAYVLFAREDKDFIDELLSRMRGEGFKLCTEDDLLPGHATQYAPVSRLISERCHRIILIYSPEFLSSPANAFYMDYAQAVGIELRKPKIIPCMYRACQLPTHLTFYHKLYYTPPGQKAAYDFWHRLSQSLEMPNLPRVNGINSTSSGLKITDISPNTTNGFVVGNSTPELLVLRSVPTKSVSLNGLNSSQSKVDDNTSTSFSQISEGKSKKIGPFRKMLNTLKKKKNKTAVLVQS